MTSDILHHLKLALENYSGRLTLNTYSTICPNKFHMIKVINSHPTIALNEFRNASDKTGKKARKCVSNTELLL